MRLDSWQKYCTQVRVQPRTTCTVREASRSDLREHCQINSAMCRPLWLITSAHPHVLSVRPKKELRSVAFTVEKCFLLFYA